MLTRFFPLLLVPLMIVSLMIVSCDSSEEDRTETVSRTQRDAPPTAKAVRSESNGNIRVESPRPGETLGSSRFTIRGTARTFEGNILYRLVYDSVITLVGGFTTASMPDAGKFGPFSIGVSYTTDWGGPAVLEVYEESAKDGREINVVRIPVMLPDPPRRAAKQVYVYFPNGGLEKGSPVDCKSVYPVRRELPQNSVALARGALYYLLKGLTEKEREAGYRTSIPEGLRLRRLALDSGIVRLQFSHHLNQVKKQCDAETVRAQIEQTLAQFPTINAVAVDVEGTAWATGR